MAAAQPERKSTSLKIATQSGRYLQKQNLPVCQAFLTSHKVFKVVVIAVGELIKINIQLLQTMNEMLLNTITNKHSLPQQLLKEYLGLGN